MAPRDINYEDTEIYKLVCNDLSVKELYVGHTTAFRARKAAHKKASKNPKRNHLKIYVRMNETGGFENWSMVLIEAYPCKSAEEARTRERYWYEEFDAELNMVRPFVSSEDTKKHKAARREANRDQINKYAATYRKTNKDKIAVRGATYYEANADQINEKARARYQAKNAAQIINSDSEN
jgi:hypothetical protein